MSLPKTEQQPMPVMTMRCFGSRAAAAAACTLTAPAGGAAQRGQRKRTPGLSGGWSGGARSVTSCVARSLGTRRQRLEGAVAPDRRVAPRRTHRRGLACWRRQRGGHGRTAAGPAVPSLLSSAPVGRGVGDCGLLLLGRDRKGTGRDAGVAPWAWRGGRRRARRAPRLVSPCCGHGGVDAMKGPTVLRVPSSCPAQSVRDGTPSHWLHVAGRVEGWRTAKTAHTTRTRTTLATHTLGAKRRKPR